MIGTRDNEAKTDRNEHVTEMLQKTLNRLNGMKVGSFVIIAKKGNGAGADSFTSVCGSEVEIADLFANSIISSHGELQKYFNEDICMLARAKQSFYDIEFNDKQ